jgi:S-DNA-T family DNA segregation ATPase FtsK/SpoIIIE
VHFPLGSVLAPLVLGPIVAILGGNVEYLAIMIASPLMAGANSMFDSHRGRRGYRAQLAEYDETLASAVTQLERSVEREELSRRERWPDPASVRTIVSTPTARLWERRRDDPDHLEVRLGLADQPAEVAITGEAPPAEPTAHQVPVTVRLRPSAVVGITGPRDDALSAVRALLLQICTLHSPNDVEIVVISDTGASDAASEWSWAKWLPHTIAGDRQTCDRLFGLDADQRARRLSELIAKIKREAGGAGFGGPARVAGPTSIAVFDHIDRLRADQAVAQVLAEGPSAGVLSICLTTEPSGLPAETTVLVGLHRTADGDALLNLGGSDVPRAVAAVLPDGVSDRHATQVARALAPVFEVAARPADHAGLPDPPLDQLPLIGLPEPTPHAVAAGWEAHRRAPAAVIGRDAAGPFEIDLERDGPHSLIAGTTGAGKSELLQTVVGSLAARSRPDELTFLLIDFKGGSAFKDCEHLPHTVGVLSNLDGRLTARALDAIQAELRWREGQFKQAGVRDYAEHAARTARPEIPRLVIVVDELKELADAYADAVPRLNQTASLGRSLGVHLVLATQKPEAISGLANLRANTDLRICLRVQDEADSRDLLGVPNAASISRLTPGRGFARLGNGRLVEFQSGYLGGPSGRAGGSTDAKPAEVWPFEAGMVGNPPISPSRAAGRDRGTGQSTELQELVDAIVSAAATIEVTAPRRPWLPPLPEVVSIDDPRIGQSRGPADIRAGLLDLPHQQRQDPLIFDLDRLSHVLVVGGTRSGRTTLLRTAAGSATRETGPADLHLYVLECRRSSLGDLGTLPHCGGVVPISDAERMGRLLTFLLAELDRRATVMGTSSSLREQRQGAASGGEPLPYLLVLCDNFDAFHERFMYEDGGRLVENFEALLRDGPARGLHMVVTTDRWAAFNRIGSLVDTHLVLRPDESASAGGPRPGLGMETTEAPPGRGAWGTERSEVQIALLAEDRSGEAQVAAVQAIASRWPTETIPPHRRPTPVRTMPTVLSLAELAGLRRSPRPQGAVATFAVGGPGAEPIDVDLRAAGFTFSVCGPRASGRSTALAAITTSLLTDAGTGFTACVLAPRRSPLRDLDPALGVRVLTDPATFSNDLGEVLVNAGGGLLLVIDDAEMLLDNPVGSRLDQLVRAAPDDDRLVLMAGTTADLSRRFSGWTFDARQSRSGLILQPGSPADGEILDLRLPRGSVGTDLPPGRGVLTVRGRWMTAQVAMTTVPDKDPYPS